MSEWQPIETAPKNMPIMVTDGVLIVVVELMEKYGPHPVGFSGYEWEWDFSPINLTHWMPLPEPPK